jgi:hypothetical protein
MPVTYVRFFPTIFVRAYDEKTCESEILFFDPVRERQTTLVGDRFRKIDFGLRRADLVVVRGTGPGFVKELQGDNVLRELLKETPLLVLQGCANYDKPICVVTPEGFKSPDVYPPIEELRQIEIESIFIRNEAIFSGEHDYHFCLPSGLHSDRFIRLADALRDRVDVLRISDWILPYLEQNNIVLADTGTLLPLLQTLQQQASILGQRLEFL